MQYIIIKTDRAIDFSFPYDKSHIVNKSEQ